MELTTIQPYICQHHHPHHHPHHPHHHRHHHPMYLFHPNVAVESDRVPDISDDQAVVDGALLEPRLDLPGRGHRESGADNCAACPHC